MDLMRLCRVCLLPEDRVHLIDWYQPIDSLDHVLSYKECFSKCTQINLSVKKDSNNKDAPATEYLCFSCAQSLKDAHDFIEKAKKADIELRSTRIDTNFEWIPVIVQEAELDNKEEPVVVDDKTLLDINLASVCHEIAPDEKDDNDDDEVMNTDNDEITSLNLKEDKLEYEPVKKPKERTSPKSRFSKNKNNYQNLSGNAKTDSDDIKLMNVDNEGFNLSNDDSDSSSVVEIKRKKFKNQNNEKDSKPKGATVNMDKLVGFEVCNKTMSRNALSQHKVYHRPRSYLCQWCPKTFSNSCHLKDHEETHKEDRERYECILCSNTYLSEYQLRKHLRLHDETDRKPTFQCSQCDKLFQTKTTLNLHKVIHEEAKEECNICQKRFFRKSDLKNHMLNHSGERPFVCSVCDKSFAHKGVLRRHMQYHDGFCRYTCVICKAEFTQYGKFYMHRRQHTGYPYKCGICGLHIEGTYKSKRHIKQVHKIENDEEIKKLTVRINVISEYRGCGVIVEKLNNIKDKDQT